MTTEGINFAHNYNKNGILWGNSLTYSENNNYYPSLYSKEVELGIDHSDSYYNNPTTSKYNQAGTEGLTVPLTFYDKNMTTNYYDNNIFNDLIHGNANAYWLASRHTIPTTEYAIFGMRYVYGNNIGR